MKQSVSAIQLIYKTQFPLLHKKTKIKNGEDIPEGPQGETIYLLQALQNQSQKSIKHATQTVKKQSEVDNRRPKGTN